MDFNFTVTPDFDDHSLKDVLKRQFRMSGAMIKNVKLRGTLEVNGVHKRVMEHVFTGDHVFASYGEDAGELKKDPDIPILYEDDYIGVCVKPAGVVTHPTHGHLDDSLLTRLSDVTLHPVMRLDRETSGLIVVAKSGYIHNAMINSPARKKYVAAVYGKYEPVEGTINKAIKRREGTIMIRDVAEDNEEGAHPSVTHYRNILYDKVNDISLVEFILETGRCHQIRVHSTYMGHPLVGDGLYGPNSNDNPREIKGSLALDEKVGRQSLHAYSLTFTHPMTHEQMHFISNIPDDMKSLFEGSSSEALDELLREVDGFGA